MRGLIILGFLLIADYWCLAQTALPGLDPTFGDRGIVLDSFTNGDYKIAYDIALQSDGKIIAVGNVVDRFTVTGKLNSTFGGTGSLPLDMLTRIPGSAATSVLIQNDGKILVAGGCDSGVFILRLKVDGTTDSSFASNGVIHYCCSEAGDRIALQADGKIIIAGQAQYHVSIFRLSQAGIPDSTFGLNGFVTTPNGQFQGSVNGLGVLNDGRISLGGLGYDSNINRALMAMRYLSDGRLDTSLNHTGIAYPLEVDYCRAVILQPDGRILYSAGNLSGDTYIFLLKLDGTIDSSYGHYGFAIVPNIQVTCMHLLPGNGLLCGGYDGDYVVAKLKPGGSLDTSFGVNGVIRNDITGTIDERVHALTVQSDGKIIAAGESRADLAYRLTLVRYLQDAKTGIRPFNSQTFRTFPNPVVDKVFTDCGSLNSVVNYYSVYALDGSLQLSGFFYGSRSIISLDGLLPGCYLISVSANQYSGRTIITKQ